MLAFYDRCCCAVLDVSIDVAGWDAILAKLNSWAQSRESRVVCICNVHSVVTAGRDEVFAKALEMADMATSDGMPLVWMLRRAGFSDQQRINGPDLMWKLCGEAEKSGVSIFLYGNTDTTLSVLQRILLTEFPALKVVGALSPPFRELTDTEDREIVDVLNRSGAGIVFVSLGCPKQEKWMVEHKGRVQAVMLGVGAAFDYHAGVIRRAPMWMQNSGLEWFYRLCSEPRRLWKRYVVTNTLFIIRLVCQKFKR